MVNQHEEAEKPERVSCILKYERPLDKRVSCLIKVEIQVLRGLTQQEFASMLGIPLMGGGYEHLRDEERESAAQRAVANCDEVYIKEGVSIGPVESFLRANGYRAPPKNPLHCIEGTVIASEFIVPNLLLQLEQSDGFSGPYLIRNSPCRINRGEKIRIYNASGHYYSHIWLVPDAVVILDRMNKPKLDIILNPDVRIKSSPFKRNDVESQVLYQDRLERDRAEEKSK